MNATPPPLIATYFTLAGDIGPFDANTVSPVPLAERAHAAAEAGYAGLGFNGQDLAHLLNTHGASGINTILDDHGLALREVEALLDWFVDGERRAASDRSRRELLAAAEAIGARHIKVIGDVTGRTWPLDHIVESFAELCDQAGEARTAITIELFPTSNLADLQTGRAVVEGAGRRNGGLLLDAWHLLRGHCPLRAIADLPGHLINHVELDDGPMLPRADYLTDTVASRCPPGEGEFPLREFVAAIRRTGYDGPYGVEILSGEFRRLPVREAAARSFTATAALFP